MTSASAQPLLIVISAPSGAGKTTLCDRLLSEHPNMRYSISCTTRRPRPGEVHGEDYFFMNEAEFLQRAAQGAFVEHALVHGNYYGTLRETISQYFHQGFDVLLDLDVQGAAQLRDYLAARETDDPMRKGFLDIFIAPPSLDALRSRLEGRGQDSMEIIEHRMQNARSEMQQADLYTHRVINADLDEAYHALTRLISTAKKQAASTS